MNRFRLPQLGPHEHVHCSGLILGELLVHGSVSDAELGLLGLLIKHPRHPVSLIGEVSHFRLSHIAPINQLGLNTCVGHQGGHGGPWNEHGAVLIQRLLLLLLGDEDPIRVCRLETSHRLVIEGTTAPSFLRGALLDLPRHCLRSGFHKVLRQQTLNGVVKLGFHGLFGKLEGVFLRMSRGLLLPE